MPLCGKLLRYENWRARTAERPGRTSSTGQGAVRDGLRASVAHSGRCAGRLRAAAAADHGAFCLPPCPSPQRLTAPPGRGLPRPHADSRVAVGCTKRPRRSIPRSPRHPHPTGGWRRASLHSPDRPACAAARMLVESGRSPNGRQNLFFWPGQTPPPVPLKSADASHLWVCIIETAWRAARPRSPPLSGGRRAERFGI